jgi:hypothetical protein
MIFELLFCGFHVATQDIYFLPACFCHNFLLLLDFPNLISQFQSQMETLRAMHTGLGVSSGVCTCILTKTRNSEKMHDFKMKKAAKTLFWCVGSLVSPNSWALR